MPVKVRCSGCEKVLNAPDKLRGKTVKCPKCQSPIKIPAPQKKKEKAEPDPFGDDFLADLDLTHAEDRSQSICPRCGASVTDDDIDCPACGASLLAAGGAVAGASKGPVGSKKKKGPNKALFYQSTWADAWAFLKKNKSYAIRTGIYLILLNLGLGVCAGMVAYCVNIPPKVIWALPAFVFFMAPFGWAWHLVTETIKTSLNKSDKLKRVNFEFFTCVALGIKYFVWSFVFGLPIAVPLNGIGAWLILNGNPIPGMIIQAAGSLIIFSMLPVALTHMAMPQQLNGWLIHKVIAGWARSLGAICYWLLIAFLTYLPIIGVAAGVGAAAGASLVSYIQAAANGAAPAFPWVPVTIALIGGIIINMLLGAYLVFNARIMGQIAYYYNQEWDLNTLEKQLKYKAKPKPGEEGEKKRINRQGLSTVATGLNMMLSSILISILCELVLFILLLCSAFGLFQAPPIVMGILAILILGAGGLFLVGVLLGFAAPPEANARLFLALSFTSPLIGIVLAIIASTVLGLAGAALGNPMALGLGAILVVLGVIVSIALTYVFFVLFLKRMSEYVYYYAGSDMADSLLFLYGAVIGIGILSGVIQGGAVAMDAAFIGSILGGILGLISLGLQISMIKTLIELLSGLKEECRKSA